MPDITSIDAVLNYEKHDYFYFVANVQNIGYHKFAKTLNTQAGVLRIGLRAQFDNFPLNGQVDSVYLHDRVLSPQEIKQLYVDPLAPFRQRRSIPFGITAAPSFNNWYARPGRTNRIVGSGVHV